MAKKTKKGVKPSKLEATAENKAKLKAEIRELKKERDKAVEDKDPKALKAVRYKIKKLKLAVKRMVIPPAPEAPAETAEAPAEAPAEAAAEAPAEAPAEEAPAES